MRFTEFLDGFQANEYRSWRQTWRSFGEVGVEMKALENTRIMTLFLLEPRSGGSPGEFHVTPGPVGKLYMPEVLKQVNLFEFLFVVRAGKLRVTESY
ncbi:hypothetical protein AVEN_78047-1 [Araneus ventricosus]|uniref:Uncharacterized protein n=1 Tax=Araneus ventricosus TaxID=182803 RepID=A0A4Y2STU8_ARAVE|nr:hypothetical protein AVEN_262313-1 [Araneus ventricosus]GBN91638.1 hypothetical protein AVEN_78047-1 [Araneus ventricosus]